MWIRWCCCWLLSSFPPHHPPVLLLSMHPHLVLLFPLAAWLMDQCSFYTPVLFYLFPAGFHSLLKSSQLCHIADILICEVDVD